jgi:hypothetical protein
VRGVVVIVAVRDQQAAAMQFFQKNGEGFGVAMVGAKVNIGNEYRTLARQVRSTHAATTCFSFTSR